LKDFQIKERHSIQFRAEAFNWLNHPNLGVATTGANVLDNGAGANPTNATFGKILLKNSERNFQFALRYSF
jgi:hypothetical protein